MIVERGHFLNGKENHEPEARVSLYQWKSTWAKIVKKRRRSAPHQDPFLGEAGRGRGLQPAMTRPEHAHPVKTKTSAVEVNDKKKGGSH